MSSRERLTRILQPVARAVETDEALAQQQTIRYAFGQDHTLRADAIPQIAYPHVISWMDEGTIALATLMPTHYLPVAYELRVVAVNIRTPATGSSVELHLEDPDDVEYASVSIAAGAEYGSTSGISVRVEAGLWLRCQITQVGSSTPGSNMSVHAVLYPFGYAQSSS